jgi:hypothetical protein
MIVRHKRITLATLHRFVSRFVAMTEIVTEESAVDRHDHMIATTEWSDDTDSVVHRFERAIDDRMNGRGLHLDISDRLVYVSEREPRRSRRTKT